MTSMAALTHRPPGADHDRGDGHAAQCAHRREDRLGEAVIDNITARFMGRDAARADYRVRVAKKGQSLSQAAVRPLRTGEVLNFPRLSYSVWHLVIRALLSAFPEERNGKIDK